MPDFDSTMLACHMASCVQLLLSFSSVLPCEHGLVFEMALLGVKACMEIKLGCLTPDLIFHHVGIASAAAAAFVWFPTHIAAVLFPQVIHVPLLIQYARRLSGGIRGGHLDVCFSAAWVFVMAARIAALTCLTARAHWDDATVRWALYPCLAGTVAVDSLWTRETFEKRELPPMWWLIALGGFGMGTYFELARVRAVWALASAGALLLAGRALLQQGAMSERHRQAKADKRGAD